MKECKKCGSSDTIVYDSRCKDGMQVRRRKCLCCDFKWMTVEVDYFEYMHFIEKEKKASEPTC